jgi:hypothetical protein
MAAERKAQRQIEARDAVLPQLLAFSLWAQAWRRCIPAKAVPSFWLELQQGVDGGGPTAVVWTVLGVAGRPCAFPFYVLSYTPARGGLICDTCRPVMPCDRATSESILSVSVPLGGLDQRGAQDLCPAPREAGASMRT